MHNTHMTCSKDAIHICIYDELCVKILAMLRKIKFLKFKNLLKIYVTIRLIFYQTGSHIVSVSNQ